MSNESKEIELKFVPVNVNVFKPDDILSLLDGSDDFTLLSVEDYQQCYLSSGDLTSRVRISNNEKAFFTCKSRSKSEDGLERDEVEFPIPLDKAKELVNISLYELNKTRYKIQHKNDSVLEFDVYKGRLEGLISLEVEFKNKKDAMSFNLPQPLSEIFVDVTHDSSYSNFILAKKGLSGLENKNKNKYKR